MGLGLCGAWVMETVGRPFGASQVHYKMQRLMGLWACSPWKECPSVRGTLDAAIRDCVSFAADGLLSRVEEQVVAKIAEDVRGFDGQ